MTEGFFSLGTALADAVHNNNLWAPGFAATMNAHNQRNFDDAVNDYNAQMRTGQKHDPPLVPPTGPFKYVVSDPDQNGFIWPVLSTTERLTPTVPIATVDLGNLTVPTPIPFHFSINWNSRPGGPRTGSTVTAFKDDGVPNGPVPFPILDPGFPNEPAHHYTRWSFPFGAIYTQTD